MSPPKLPLEILLMIARLLTDDDGELCCADFNSFLKVNGALYACLNRTLWQAAVDSESIAKRAFTHLIRTNNVARLEFFLELGANPETAVKKVFDIRSINWDSMGTVNTPLKVAIRLDYVPMACLLLEHGAKLVHNERFGSPGYSAIHGARSAEMVQLLLDHHADPEQLVVCSGYRPLHFYAKRDNIEAMRAVLRKGVDVDPVSASRTSLATPLHYAAMHNVEAVELLLAHGADLKKKTLAEETPLHWAAEAGKADVVRLLLERWPDGCREKTEKGLTPLHVAARMGHAIVVRLLVERWPEGMREKTTGSECTPFHLAASDGRTDVVRLLFELWPEGVREKNTKGHTALHMAAWEGRVNMVRLLVEIWPKGQKALDGCGLTPLSLLEKHARYGRNKKELITLLGGVYSTEVNHD
jgi:ankyrin repeat protein